MISATFECIAEDEMGAIRCVHRRCDDFAKDHPWHFHPQFELVWVIHSEGTRFVGDSVERYCADDLVLTGPNLAHCWRNDRDTPDAHAAEWIVLQFDKRCVGEDFIELPEAAPIRDLLHAARRGVAFATPTAQTVGPLLRQMVALAGMRRLIKLLEILHILTGSDGSLLASESSCPQTAVNNRLVTQLEQIQSYISKHFRGVASQSDIAAQLEMTPAAFSKFMRANTGRTFMSMLKLARINEGCRLLSTSSARITDIALDCGYQHTSHFDRHFMEIKGLSPREYRERMRALEASSAALAAA